MSALEESGGHGGQSMREGRTVRLFTALLASRKRFLALTLCLFLVYIAAYVVFVQVETNEQRYFLFAFGLVVSSLFFSWLLGGKATFFYVTFFSLFFTFIYSIPLFHEGTLYPRLFLSRSFLIIVSSFTLLVILMVFKKSPADIARTKMAREAKEEREKARLLEFLVTEKKITEDVVAQSNYAKDELLFLQGTWRSQIHNIVNDLPADRENDIYREIIEPFQDAILRHLKGLEKKLIFDPAPTQVGPLAETLERELGADLKNLSGRYEIAFRLEPSDRLLKRKVHCDALKVVEIIRNLMKNAQKAIELSQIDLMKRNLEAYRSFRPYLSILMKGEGEHLLIEVTDNGGGLREEYLRKVFREPIPSSKQGRYGRGTTFVKFFSDRMGFRVSGENVFTPHGKGFRVKLEIPYQGR